MAVKHNFYTLFSQESQVKIKKQNGYNNMYSCSIALVVTCVYKIQQTTTGAISVIRQTASARDC